MTLSPLKLPHFDAWTLLAAIALPLLSAMAAEPALTPAGVARIDISPEQPVTLMGYAARAKLAPSAAVAQRIHARALALGSDPDAAILITVDNCILPAAVTDQVRQRLGTKAGLRPERVTVAVTHTHSAPCLTGAAPNILGRDFTADEQAAIDGYTQSLVAKLEAVALAALADRKPALLAWGKGNAGFGKNRRTPGGPVDHDLPLLRITSPAGELRGVFLSYACHCTTLGGNFNEVHGDWAGVAADVIEREHPAAIALVAVACGADQNPDPRGTPELTTQHGEEIAHEVERLLPTDLTPIAGSPECRLKTIDLPFQPLFTRAEWELRAAAEGIVGFHARKWLARLDRGEAPPPTLPYPVQTWRFGDQLALVFLGGEVVVDYSLRLKRELDPSRLWLSAYSNSVPCYIPSRRILAEGGYEPETSLWYYDRPQRLSPEIEDLIVHTVHDLLPPTFATAPPPNLDLAPSGGGGAGGGRVERGEKDHALSPPPTPPTPAPPQSTPISPSDALKAFRVRPGFEVQLVASEPLIESPVAIDFGADGRLWVCEMRDYPTGMDGNGKPGGRIKVLSDRDRDGHYDSAEIWADDLPFPTGLMAWRDGVIVCAAPDVWLLTPDHQQKVAAAPPASNSITVPTHREKLLTGFNTGNFQARVNGLRWGLDGWIHGSGGLFGGKITVVKTGQTIDCTNRDFRFRPDTGEFEPLAGVSQQGHVRDDFDQWFGNDNSTLLWHFPLPDRYRRRNPFVNMPPARVANSRDADPGQVFPASSMAERFNHPESAGRITSGCGPEIYRDELLGGGFAGNAFVCEPVHNLVRRAVVEPDDATFLHHRAPGEESSEFLASTDPWCRPVEARTGPDGALWVVDMPRSVIEHPRWIPPDRLRELNVRAGAESGRIWRVVPIRTKSVSSPDLTKLPASALAKVLDSPNGPTRDLAHRLFLDIPAPEFSREALPLLRQSATQSARPAGRAQALAILENRHLLDSDLSDAAVRDSDPRVRRFAVSLFETAHASASTASEPPASLLALVHDPALAVRFQLALTLSGFPHERTGRALAELAGQDGANELLRAAILTSIPAAPDAFTTAFAEQKSCDAPELEPLREAIATTLLSSSRTDALFHWIASRFPDDRPIGNDKNAEASHLIAILVSKPDISNELLTRLRRQLEGTAAQTIRDPKQKLPARTAALKLLGEIARQDDSRRADLLALLDADLPEPLPAALTAALQRQTAPQFGAEMLAHWTARPPSQRLLLLPVLLSRDRWTEALLTALENGDVSVAEIAASQRQQLRNHRNPELRARAAKLFPTAASDRAAVVQRFRPVADMKGDPVAGVAHFDRLCATCHQLKEHGHSVGPDLASFRGKPVEDYLTAILDPNAAIEPHFAMWTAETKDGRTLAGVIREESSTALTLVQPGGTTATLPRQEIAHLQSMPISLMPVGLELGLTPQNLADLIAWLQAVP